MSKKFVLAGGVLVFLVLQVFFASGAEPASTAFSTTYEPQPDFQTYYTSQNINDYWPALSGKEGECTGRQDFVLQVAPAGCQPMVIRSDLLAEQNVPVFCQIDAMQLNPLINVKEIKNIRFSGSYPSSVAGTGFHPARAALRTRDTLLGSPLINNIGYAVIILKKNPNEATLPKSVTVNLSAQLEYDSGNALGIGRTEFLLKEASEEAWDSEKTKYGFWNGRYFLRLENVDSNVANLAIYDGDRKVSSIRAEKGKTSNTVYLPGMYCQAGLEANYQGLVSGGAARAKVEVVSDDGKNSFEVSEGSSFDSGRCSVRKITSDTNLSGQGFGKVELSCRGNSPVTLELKPVAAGMISAPDGKTGLIPREFKRGENVIYYYVEVSKENKGELEAGIYGVDSEGNFYYLAASVKNIKSTGGVPLLDKDGKALVKTSSVWYGETRKKLVSLSKFISSGGKETEGSEFVFFDIELSDATAEEEFNDAIAAYERVAKEYPAERSADAEGAINYGEQALMAALKLAQSPQLASTKKGTQRRLLSELIEMYPNSKYVYEWRNQLSSLVTVDDAKAMATLKIDGKYRTIRLSGIEVDSPPSASFRIGSGPSTFSLVEKEYSGNESALKLGVSSRSSTVKSIGKLTSLRLERVIDSDSVEVSVWCDETKNRVLTPVSKGKKILRVNDAAEEFCTAEPVKLESINTTSVAKVILTPKVSGSNTLTNISITIGIEKRAIQLSPDRMGNVIETLNKSINKWEKVSEQLGKTITTLKTTCLATSALLIVKNLVTGFGGTSMARTQTMSGENGWIARCEAMVAAGTEDTVTRCLNKNEDKINAEIEAREKAMDETNEFVEGVEKVGNITTSGSLFREGSVDSQQAAQEMLKRLKEGEFKNDSRVIALAPADNKGRTAYTYTELRDLYYNLKLEKAGYEIAGREANKTANNIKAEQARLDIVSTSESNKGLGATPSPKAATLTVLAADFYKISSGKVGVVSVTNLNESDEGKFGVVILNASGGRYLFVGDKNADGRLKPIIAVYIYSETNGAGSVSGRITDSGQIGALLAANGILDLKDSSEGTEYNTPISELYMKVRFFDTEPFKGMPAYVPFDAKKGWYARVEPKLGLMNTQAAYDKSGLPRSWKICNAGSDGVVGNGDDCQIVEEGISTGVTVLGQPEAESRRLIQQSRSALIEAASQSNLQRVKIGGQTFNRDSSAEPVLDAAQCQNFMSISDCRILFNVCDPVICPPSRCDFGGTYRVANVIQSGIVGSVLLCLPNIQEPIFIPVCLTGIQAGIDSWLSILKNHRDCLQNSLDTGQMTGICDEMYSVYQCEFFWRQFAPLANMLLPKLVSMASGETQSRGGGEYLQSQAAWENAQNSMSYITQNYASDSFKAFNIRSIEDIGTEVCRGSISVSFPKSFESVAEPESPPQFQAWFDATKFSDVTVPPTAQYKVFYHIYAGKTASTSYQVYLKSPPESSYYYSTPTVQVASGFIAAGQYASETKDFTAPEGYRELCVRINNEEKCGFKQVSTSFAVNYMRDSYVQDKLTETDIRTEQGCTSGSPNLGAVVANINPLSAGEEALMPQDYKRGIIRICASKNPGASTDPGRYQDVGYCGEQKLRCWLDRESVDRAISSENIGAREETLKELDAEQKATLESKGFLVSNQANAKLSAVEEELKKTGGQMKGKAQVIVFVNEKVVPLFEQLVMNHHKARLLLIEADAWAKPTENRFADKAYTPNVPISEKPAEPEKPVASVLPSCENDTACGLGGKCNLSIKKCYYERCEAAACGYLPSECSGFGGTYLGKSNCIAEECCRFDQSKNCTAIGGFCTSPSNCGAATSPRSILIDYAGKRGCAISPPQICCKYV